MGINDSFEPKPKHHPGKIILIIFASIIGLFITVFLVLFVYYLWQFRYAPPEKFAQTYQKFESGRFTLIDNTNKQGPKITKDAKTYIRKNNPTIGKQNGKITVLAFIDFSCPFTQESYPIFNEVMDKYGSVAQFVIKHLPLSATNPDSLNPMNAATCAHDQQKYFLYYNLLFQNLKFSKPDLDNYAEKVGLDSKKFNSCYNNLTHIGDLDQDTKDAIELGVRGTPTYFINKDIIEGVASLKTWDQTILRNLK